MRILMASFVGDNRWSGMGKWSHETAGALGRVGHDVTLWFAGDFPRLAKTGTLAKLLFPPVLAARITRDARRWDVVILHEPSGLWYAGLRRLRRSLPTMVLMCHNVESRNLHDLKRAAARGFADVPLSTRVKAPLFRLWQSDYAIRLADHVVCLSDGDADYVTNRLGRRPDAVTIATNGAACDDGDARRDTRSAGVRGVLFVGGWTNEKGKYVVPKMWSRVLERFPDASLTLVGTHESAETVLGAFAPADRPSLRHIPRLTDPGAMRAQYESHDVLVMPSISEGSPLALLEAMACKMAVVASRVGGIPRVVTDGIDGLLVEPMNVDAAADQVCALLGDDALRRRLGGAARARAKSLTWDATARTMLHAIESARRADEPPRGRR